MADQPIPKNWFLTINGVNCNVYLGPNPEQPGSYGITEANIHDGRRATVWFICYWVDRLNLIAGLLGTVDYTGGTVVRTDPFAYPLASADNQSGEVFKNRLFCTDIIAVQGIAPWRDDIGEVSGLAGWISYQYALIQAEFTSPPYLIEDLLGPGITPNDPSFNDLTYQTYIISKVRVSGEVFSPPTGSFKWASGAFESQPLLDVGASQIRTRFDISITRVRMPLVPLQTIAELEGTVNDAAFLIGGQSFPKGALLFMGCNPEPRSDPYNGGIVQDVEYLFQGNAPASNNDTDGTSLDWNYFLDPGGVWSKVTTAGGDPVFEYADHSALYGNTID